ncbi:hypothetical protein [Paraburkholderia sediminicola]|uniref:hypothetical protein n=1 Tax=Paraburkholderia sediminicola TaxID=458836 RepID=UPI0038B9B7F2
MSTIDKVKEIRENGAPFTSHAHAADMPAGVMWKPPQIKKRVSEILQKPVFVQLVRLQDPHSAASPNFNMASTLSLGEHAPR